MTGIDYGFILEQLIRNYYIVLFMVPMLLVLTHMDKGAPRTEVRRIRHSCALLTLLILANVFGKWFSTLPEPTGWRILYSAIGYSIRPLCLLLLLRDDGRREKKNRRKAFLLTLPAILNTIVSFSAFFSPIAFYYSPDNHFYRGPLNYTTVIVSGFYLFLICVRAFRDYRHGKKTDSIGLMMMCSACFGAAILEMYNIPPSVPLLNQSIAVSIILYYLWQYMRTSTEKINNLTLSLLLMQIRPHFINNCLSVIRGLMRTDTELAADALNHFSNYLQNSTHMIAQTQMIPLSQEMKMIDDYLQLEQIRFNHSFAVERDFIEQDFLVPPLTIQPLVENAVRHGLRGISKQGHLLIRTQMDKNEYRVIISDNGSGFNPQEKPSGHRPHIGLQNVRERLKMMCGGSLTISSGPDGTLVTVHIPLSAEEKKA